MDEVPRVFVTGSNSRYNNPYTRDSLNAALPPSEADTLNRKPVVVDIVNVYKPVELPARFTGRRTCTSKFTPNADSFGRFGRLALTSEEAAAEKNEELLNKKKAVIKRLLERRAQSSAAMWIATRKLTSDTEAADVRATLHQHRRPAFCPSSVTKGTFNRHPEYIAGATSPEDEFIPSIPRAAVATTTVEALVWAEGDTSPLFSIPVSPLDSLYNIRRKINAFRSTEISGYGGLGPGDKDWVFADLPAELPIVSILKSLAADYDSYVPEFLITNKNSREENDEILKQIREHRKQAAYIRTHLKKLEEFAERSRTADSLFQPLPSSKRLSRLQPQFFGNLQLVYRPLRGTLTGSCPTMKQLRAALKPVIQAVNDQLCRLDVFRRRRAAKEEEARQRTEAAKALRPSELKSKRGAAAIREKNNTADTIHQYSSAEALHARLEDLSLDPRVEEKQGMFGLRSMTINVAKNSEGGEVAGEEEEEMMPPPPATSEVNKLGPYDLYDAVTSHIYHSRRKRGVEFYDAYCKYYYENRSTKQSAVQTSRTTARASRRTSTTATSPSATQSPSPLKASRCETPELDNAPSHPVNTNSAALAAGLMRAQAELLLPIIRVRCVNTEAKQLDSILRFQLLEAMEMEDEEVGLSRIKEVMGKHESFYCDKPDTFGVTPLHEATLRNAVAYVEAIVRGGGNPRAVDWRGQTALHYAAERGLVQCASAIATFTQGASRYQLFDIKDNRGYTAKYCAIRGLHWGVLDIILSHGGTLSDEELHLCRILRSPEAAIGSQDTETVHFYLQRAKMGINHPVGYRGETMLALALQTHGLDRMVAFLLELGADPTVSDTLNGDTPLHIAIKRHQKAWLRILLKKIPEERNGTLQQLVNRAGDTLVHTALKYTPSADVDEVATLVAEHPSYMISCRTLNKSGETLIHLAALRRAPNIFKIVVHLAHGLPLSDQIELLSTKDTSGDTAIAATIRADFPQGLTKLLMLAGAGEAIHVPCSLERNALLFAIHREAALQQIRSNNDLADNAPHTAHRTEEHCVYQLLHSNVVYAPCGSQASSPLCARRLSVDAVTGSGGVDSETPLHAAMRLNMWSTASMLLSYGAAINVPNGNGDTVWDMACASPTDVSFVKLFVSNSRTPIDSVDLVIAVVRKSGAASRNVTLLNSLMSRCIHDLSVPYMDTSDSIGTELLRSAAVADNLTLFALLVDRGAATAGSPTGAALEALLLVAAKKKRAPSVKLQQQYHDTRTTVLELAERVFALGTCVTPMAFLALVYLGFEDIVDGSINRMDEEHAKANFLQETLFGYNLPQLVALAGTKTLSLRLVVKLLRCTTITFERLAARDQAVADPYTTSHAKTNRTALGIALSTRDIDCVSALVSFGSYIERRCGRVSHTTLPQSATHSTRSLAAAVEWLVKHQVRGAAGTNRVHEVSRIVPKTAAVDGMVAVLESLSRLMRAQDDPSMSPRRQHQVPMGSLLPTGDISPRRPVPDDYLPKFCLSSSIIGCCVVGDVGLLSRCVNLGASFEDDETAPFMEVALHSGHLKFAREICDTCCHAHEEDEADEGVEFSAKKSLKLAESTAVRRHLSTTDLALGLPFILDSNTSRDWTALYNSGLFTKSRYEDSTLVDRILGIEPLISWTTAGARSGREHAALCVLSDVRSSVPLTTLCTQHTLNRAAYLGLPRVLEFLVSVHPGQRLLAGPLRCARKRTTQGSGSGDLYLSGALLGRLMEVVPDDQTVLSALEIASLQQKRLARACSTVTSTLFAPYTYIRNSKQVVDACVPARFPLLCGLKTLGSTHPVTTSVAAVDEQRFWVKDIKRQADREQLERTRSASKRMLLERSKKAITQPSCRSPLHIAVLHGRYHVFELAEGVEKSSVSSIAVPTQIVSPSRKTVAFNINQQQESEGDEEEEEDEDHTVDDDTIDVDVADSLGRTPLMDAARVGNVDFVHMLLLNGAGLLHEDINGFNCVHHAARAGNVRVLSRLLADEDAVDAVCSPSSVPAATYPVMVALQNGNDDAAAMLLTSPVSDTCPTEIFHPAMLETLLHFAALRDCVQAIDALVGRSPPEYINAKTKDGYLPVDYSIPGSETEMALLVHQSRAIKTTETYLTDRDLERNYGMLSILGSQEACKTLLHYNPSAGPQVSPVKSITEESWDLSFKGDDIGLLRLLRAGETDHMRIRLYNIPFLKSCAVSADSSHYLTDEDAAEAAKAKEKEVGRLLHDLRNALEPYGGLRKAEIIWNDNDEEMKETKGLSGQPSFILIHIDADETGRLLKNGITVQKTSLDARRDPPMGPQYRTLTSPPHTTILHNACRTDCIASIMFVIRNNTFHGSLSREVRWLFDSMKDESGMSPLHYAVIHNHLQLVIELLKAGVDHSVPDDAGYMPLQYLTSSAAQGLLRLGGPSAVPKQLPQPALAWWAESGGDRLSELDAGCLLVKMTVETTPVRPDGNAVIQVYGTDMLVPKGARILDAKGKLMKQTVLAHLNDTPARELERLVKSMTSRVEASSKLGKYGPGVGVLQQEACAHLRGEGESQLQLCIDPEEAEGRASQSERLLTKLFYTHYIGGGHGGRVLRSLLDGFLLEGSDFDDPSFHPIGRLFGQLCFTQIHKLEIALATVETIAATQSSKWTLVQVPVQPRRHSFARRGSVAQRTSTTSMLAVTTSEIGAKRLPSAHASQPKSNVGTTSNNESSFSLIDSEDDDDNVEEGTVNKVEVRVVFWPEREFLHAPNLLQDAKDFFLWDVCMMAKEIYFDVRRWKRETGGRFTLSVVNNLLFPYREIWKSLDRAAKCTSPRITWAHYASAITKLWELKSTYCRDPVLYDAKCALKELTAIRDVVRDVVTTSVFFDNPAGKNHPTAIQRNTHDRLSIKFGTDSYDFGPTSKLEVVVICSQCVGVQKNSLREIWMRYVAGRMANYAGLDRLQNCLPPTVRNPQFRGIELLQANRRSRCSEDAVLVVPFHGSYRRVMDTEEENQLFAHLTLSQREMAGLPTKPFVCSHDDIDARDSAGYRW